MADMQSLLQLWNFEKYVDIFIENEVDIEALELIDDNQLKVLIPAVGPQAKFKKKLIEWKEKNRLLAQYEPDGELERIVDVYGHNVGGLTSGVGSPFGSPSVSSVASSVTLSTHSDISAISTDQNAIQDLILLLQKSQDGKVLLKRRLEPLGDQLRKILTKQIATEVLNKDPKLQVTVDIYQFWVDEIKRVFPAENTAIYYTRPPDGLRRPYGRLYDAVTNLKAKYRKNKLYVPRTRRSLNTNLVAQQTIISRRSFSATETEEDTAPLPDIDEAVEWLHSSVNNLSLCQEKWDKTRSRRRKEVLSGGSGSYFQEFPCLKRSWGYTLLLSDFHEWYPENEDAFEDKFRILKNKILSLANKISAKSTFVAELKVLAADPDPETNTLAALLLIPHLLGPTHVKRNKRSAAEVRDSFILHINDEKLLADEVKKVCDRSKELCQNVQPYIMVAGPLKHIIHRFVVVDDIKYELPSIIKAVDTCFKIIWSLYLEYTPDCLPVWQFLQRAIYNIPKNSIDPKEKIPASVFGLISDCGLNDQ